MLHSFFLVKKAENNGRSKDKKGAKKGNYSANSNLHVSATFYLSILMLSVCFRSVNMPLWRKWFSAIFTDKNWGETEKKKEVETAEELHEKLEAY